MNLLVNFHWEEKPSLWSLLEVMDFLIHMPVNLYITNYCVVWFQGTCPAEKTQSCHILVLP